MCKSKLDWKMERGWMKERSGKWTFSTIWCKEPGYDCCITAIKNNWEDTEKRWKTRNYWPIQSYCRFQFTIWNIHDYSNHNDCTLHSNWYFITISTKYLETDWYCCSIKAFLFQYHVDWFNMKIEQQGISRRS